MASVRPTARGRRAAELARRRRRNLLTFGTVAALLAPLVLASIWVLANVQHSTAGNADVALEVQQGWSAAQVGDALQQAGVIASATQFQQVAESASHTTFTAGRYIFVAN